MPVDIDLIVGASLLVSAIFTALIAGIFYGFSSFVMPALARLPDAQGVEAMRAINVMVYTPSFMLPFMGAALLTAGLAIQSLFTLGGASSQLVLIAAALYLFGTFGITMLCNVPLNTRLVDVPADEAIRLWPQFVPTWTRWNSLRTAASAASALLLTATLLCDRF